MARPTLKFHRFLRQSVIGTVTGLLLVGCDARGTTSVPTGHHPHTFTKGRAKLNYLLFIPEDYGQETGREWPLIVFLHGVGERSDELEDLDLLREHGLSKVVEQQPDFSFIVISPQCPAESYWDYELDGLDALLDEIVADYAIDTSRLYLTGLSMGGFGTWRWALRQPDRFAAIVPIAGGYEFGSDSVPENICDLKGLPTWVFHGALDTAVLPQQSEVMVSALRACGGDVRFTLYPDAEHDSWTETYANPELYAWLLQHTR